MEEAEAEAQAEDWSDWRQQWDPYNVLAQKLSEEQTKEAFEEKMKRDREKFEKEERERRLDLLYPFSHRIWFEGIEKVRKKMVPAYTFAQFGFLPTEVQAQIWSIAARFEDPKLRIITAMSEKRVVGSSLIDYGGWRREPFLAILHVYQLSRAEALEVDTEMSTTTKNLYINTLYDNFYMGEKKWDQFKVLIDLVIQENTTRPLVQAVQTDLFGLLNIRFLMVDLNIFGAAPVKLWAKFSKLEKLSIIFYPWEDIKDNELLRDGVEKVDPVFVKPQRGSRHGKRADWVVDLATRSIEKAKTEAIPGWRAPKVEALVRKTGTEIDFEIEEEFTDDEVTEEYDDSDDEREGRERGEAEASWRRQAAARMTHAPVTREKFKVWKRKYLPSKEVWGMDFLEGKRELGTYYTDSETEQGNFPDPYEEY